MISKIFFVLTLFLLSATVEIGCALAYGTTGASFLKIATSPRAAGMGEAQVATCDDVTGIFWNPAGLGRIKGQEFSLMYNLWLEGIRVHHFAYASPLGSRGAVAGSIVYLAVDDIQGYDANGVKTGKVRAYDLLGSLSYGTILLPAMYAGVNLKFIQENLDEESSSPIATDIGIIGSVGKLLMIKGWENRLNCGITIQNLGGIVKFEKERASLPLNLKFGIGIDEEVFGNSMIIAIDGNFPREGDPYAGLGVEYWLKNIVGLRVGFKNGQDMGNGLSFGVGIGAEMVRIDYALVRFGELGYTHRMGLLIRLGKGARKFTIRRIFEKGMEHYNNGKYPEAILEFNKVLELDPENKKALEMMKKANEKLIRGD